MKAQKLNVRVNLVMDIEVSEDYFLKLQKNLLVEICKHCFKNNSKTIISHSLEVKPQNT